MNKVLTTLSLNDNEFDDDGVTELANVMKYGSSNIERLELNFNYITDASETDIVKMIQKKKHLNYLSLANNCISQAAQERITEAAQQYNVEVLFEDETENEEQTDTETEEEREVLSEKENDD
jgi:hypothetical protein